MYIHTLHIIFVNFLSKAWLTIFHLPSPKSGMKFPMKWNSTMRNLIWWVKLYNPTAI